MKSPRERLGPEIGLKRAAVSQAIVSQHRVTAREHKERYKNGDEEWWVDLNDLCNKIIK